MLDHWSDYLATIWSYFFGTIGVILNLVLIFLIFKYTPITMRVYATVLRVGAICDFFTSFCVIMGCARVYSTGSSLIIMFHGAAKNLPISRTVTPYVCFLFYVYAVHGYLFGMFVILFSLYYRQRTVTSYQGAMSQKHVNQICYGSSILFLMVSTFLGTFGLPSIDEIDNLVEAARPELIGSGWTYYIIPNIGGLSESLVFGLNWIVLIYGIVRRFRIHRALISLNMSSATKQMQKSLMNILSVQIITAFVPIFPLIIHYISTFRNDLQTPLEENTIELLPILLPFISPIVTIHFIEPYRKAVKQIYRVNPISSVTVVSDGMQSSTEQF